MNQQTIAHLRAQTPGCHKTIHLNNVGASLMPQPVYDTIVKYQQQELLTGGYETANANQEAIHQSYQAIALLINTQKQNIAFTTNATDAFSRALSSVPFKPNDTILTTQQDYASNQIAFLSLAKRFGIKIIRAKDTPSGPLDLDKFESLIIQYHPKLISITHVPTNSGLIQPIEEIGRLCQKYDILYLLDACQSIGQIPLDVLKIQCDFLSATSRKFLRGPRGMGFLYISDKALNSGLEPLFIEGRGADWIAENLYQPRKDATRFEGFEFNIALLLGMGEAARYASKIGIEAIEKRVKHLAEHTRNTLKTIPNAQVLDKGENLCAIVTVHIPGWDPTQLKNALAIQNIHTSISTKEWGLIDFQNKQVDWALRLSPHAYNTIEEIDFTKKVLERIISK